MELLREPKHCDGSEAAAMPLSNVVVDGIVAVVHAVVGWGVEA